MRRPPHVPWDKAAFIERFVASGIPRDLAECAAVYAEAGQTPGPYRTGPVDALRLVDDGLEPRVFSDGRGDGAREMRWCWYCGEEANYCGDLIAEHMQPRSARGADDASNLVGACRSCNTIKGYKSVEEYRYLMSARLDTTVVFAGEAGVYVEQGPGFSYLDAIGIERRKQIIEDSLLRKLPDPPTDDTADLFKNCAAKGLL